MVSTIIYNIRQMSKAAIIIGVVVVVIVVVVVVLVVTLQKNSNKNSNNQSNSSNNGTSNAYTPTITTGEIVDPPEKKDSSDTKSSSDTKVPPPPEPPTLPAPSAAVAFKKIFSSGYWASEKPGAYVCNGAEGRNVKGDEGNYANYCIFDNQNDVEKYCTTDKACRGYVGITGKYQAVAAEPIPSTVTNGVFYGSSRFY